MVLCTCDCAIVRTQSEFTSELLLQLQAFSFFNNHRYWEAKQQPLNLSQITSLFGLIVVNNFCFWICSAVTLTVCVCVCVCVCLCVSVSGWENTLYLCVNACREDDCASWVVHVCACVSGFYWSYKTLSVNITDSEEFKVIKYEFKAKGSENRFRFNGTDFSHVLYSVISPIEREQSVKAVDDIRGQWRAQTATDRHRHHQERERELSTDRLMLSDHLLKFVFGFVRQLNLILSPSLTCTWANTRALPSSGSVISLIHLFPRLLIAKKEIRQWIPPGPRLTCSPARHPLDVGKPLFTYRGN